MYPTWLDKFTVKVEKPPHTERESIETSSHSKHVLSNTFEIRSFPFVLFLEIDGKKCLHEFVINSFDKLKSNDAVLFRGRVYWFSCSYSVFLLVFNKLVRLCNIMLGHPVLYATEWNGVKLKQGENYYGKEFFSPLFFNGKYWKRICQNASSL